MTHVDSLKEEREKTPTSTSTQPQGGGGSSGNYSKNGKFSPLSKSTEGGKKGGFESHKMNKSMDSGSGSSQGGVLDTEEEEMSLSRGSGSRHSQSPPLLSSQDSSCIFKTIKVYKNGHPDDRLLPILLELDKKGQSWMETLRLFHDAVQSPVQKVFTVVGKRVLSWSELRTLDEVVVCGNHEQFKMMPYGKTDICKSNGTSRISLEAKRGVLRINKGRKSDSKEGKSLAKSVIVGACLGENENLHGNGQSPLVKTLSEQDVSLMDASNKLRLRNSSPKVRPISAYMSGSVERRNLGGGVSVSRIPVPKRISTPLGSSVYSPYSTTNCNVTNSTANCTPSAPPNHLSKPRRIEKTPVGVTAVASEHASRRGNDAARNEFVRPRLVTVIRHGMKPRKAIRFLLNKKTARSYDQVLNELTESMKPDWGAIRKVYTLSGSDVSCLEDFFGSDDIFLACPNDKLGTNDFDLDSEECKSIQPYVKVSLAFKQSRFKGLEASRSPHRRPKSCSSSQNQSPQYATHPKYIPLSHFPSAILDKYYVGNIIGDGNFAVVREISDRQNKNRFALKVIDKAKCYGRDAPPEHEVTILSMVNHPNIVEMYEQYDFSNELYIVLELIEGGDLFDAIAAVTKFSERDSASMTRDVASALAFLHSLQIAHRDIKPENLLVYTQSDGKRRIKLGDFGLAKIADGPLFTVCGTPTYVAPEILAECGYGLKVDIWALGVIVYVLLCGFPPFISPTGEQEALFELILSGCSVEFPTDEWENISEDAKDIINRMIEPDVDMRLSAEEVLEHPWLGENLADTRERRQRRRGDFNCRVFEAMGLTSPLSLSHPSA